MRKLATGRVYSLAELVGEALSEINELQGRVQELEDRELLEKPYARIAALEANNADLQQRIAALENQPSRALTRPNRRKEA